MAIIRTILIAATLAAAATINVVGPAAAPAPPQSDDDDDDDCDDIMDELMELANQVKKQQPASNSTPAICAANGQMLGIVKASRTAAAECYDKGKKRDDLLAEFDKTIKQLDGTIGSTCK